MRYDAINFIRDGSVEQMITENLAKCNAQKHGEANKNCEFFFKKV